MCVCLYRRNFNREKEYTFSTVHWHHSGVNALCFTPEGRYPYYNQKVLPCRNLIVVIWKSQGTNILDYFLSLIVPVCPKQLVVWLFCCALHQVLTCWVGVWSLCWSSGATARRGKRTSCPASGPPSKRSLCPPTGHSSAPPTQTTVSRRSSHQSHLDRC